MQKLKFVLLFFILPGLPLAGQNIPEMKFNQFEPLLQRNNDTTYVINFWATWCKPCVEEIPEFLKAASDLEGKKVKFVFVSLDFPSQKTTRLVPFVKKHKMNDMVILLNDPDSNEWIGKIDGQWSGAIPATLVYKGSDRSFYEKTLTYNEIINTIKSK